jgi:hypothetical protein
MRRIPWRFKRPSGLLSSHAAAPSPASAGQQQPSEQSELLQGGMRAWIGALKLTALLAVAGFIGKLAVQQFLGIELAHWTAPDLSLFAGRWAMDTVNIVVERLISHPFLFGIPVLLVLLPPLLSVYLPHQHPAMRFTTYSSIGIAAAGLLYVLVWCEMPTSEMNGWPIQDLNVQMAPPGPGLHAARVADLKAILLVSKMDGVAEHNGTYCNNAVPDTLKPHLKAEYPVQTAQNYLNAIYAWSVVICVAAFLILYLRAPVEEPALIDNIFTGIRIIASLILLPLASCMIPYMYGKLIYPTTFPVVFLTYTNGETGKEMLLMDKSDTEVTLLLADLNDAQGIHVVQKRREDIKSIRKYKYQDLLNVMLRQCNWEPSPQGNVLK